MKKFTDVVNENKVVENNDKIIESIDTERMSLVHEIAGEVIQYMNNFVADRKLNEEEKNMLVQTIIDDMNNEFEENGELSNDDDVVESGYGTSHLKKQGVSLGKILTEVEELVAGETYCIVDLGLNAWNGGYTWLRKDGTNFVFQDELSGPTEPKDIIYSEEDMSEMIENGQIAFEL